MSDQFNQPPDKKTSFTQTGAILHTQHVEDTIVIYPISEDKLKTISICNAISTAFFSVGFGLAVFALDKLFDIQMSTGGVDPDLWLVLAICVIGAILCFAVAIWTTVERLLIVRKIKNKPNILVG